MKQVHQKSIYYSVEEKTLAQVQHLPPGFWLVAAAGALQYTPSEFQDRITCFYNSRVRINAAKDYKSSFILPASPRKDISIPLNSFFWYFTKTFLSNFCAAEDLFDKKKVSKFSWLADNISESRNTDALHMSEEMLWAQLNSEGHSCRHGYHQYHQFALRHAVMTV